LGYKTANLNLNPGNLDPNSQVYELIMGLRLYVPGMFQVSAMIIWKSAPFSTTFLTYVMQ
jgi:hypothetical protein